MGSDSNVRLDPVFLRHDLMIELGRLDMAITRMETNGSQGKVCASISDLEARRAQLSEALSRLPV